MAGFGLALFALVLLSALAPFHQTSRLMRDLRQAGYTADLGWSICTGAQAPVAPRHNSDDHSADMVRCPAQGIGKSDLALILPDVPTPFVPHARLVVFGRARPRLCRRCRPGTTRARAPPVQI
jgi:hypothetical protein